VQNLDALSHSLDCSQSEPEASALLPMFPPLAPVPPPPFHPARNTHPQPTRDQATLLAPSSYTQTLSAPEQVRLIRETVQAFAAATRPQEVLQALLSSLKRIHHFTACSVLLREEAGQYEFYAAAQYALSERFLEETIKRLEHEGMLHGLPPVERASLIQSQVVDVLEKRQSHLLPASAEHLEFLLVHPLARYGTCAGVLGIAGEHAEKAPAEQAELLAVLLDAAAAALEHAHLMQAQQRLWEEVHTERQQIEQWKDQFLSTVSHELRTPLTPIKGFTQHLLRRTERKLAEIGSQGSDEQAKQISSIKYEQRSLEIIQSEAEHLERLVNTLLDVSMLQRGKLRVQLHCFDLAELIEQTVRSVQLSAEQHEITLCHMAEKTMLCADRERLRSILGNLLENAMKYSPEGGVVEVSLLARDEEYLVTVSDQGEGIPSEQIEHLFERFHQPISPGAQHVDGIGVSLYHAQAILQLHGGRIWAERHEQEAGVTFAFALPRQLTPPDEQQGSGSAVSSRAS
jgi:signal transduction histidine kinase